MYKNYFKSQFFDRLSKQAVKELFIHCAKTIGIYGSIAIAFTDTFTYCAQVSGSSMQPIINPSNESQDILLLCRVPIKLNHLKRGDVVSLTSPKYPNERLLKRIVGLPGDIVKTKYPFKREYIKVPPGHCWIEGIFNLCIGFIF
jgi:inner membrane protease subunit 2